MHIIVLLMLLLATCMSCTTAEPEAAVLARMGALEQLLAAALQRTDALEAKLTRAYQRMDAQDVCMRV